MSWNVKYRLEFSDFKNIPWKIEIEDSSIHTPINLTGSEYPLVFEYNNESDDVFEPFKSSKANISFISSTMFEYANLYSTEDLQYRVNCYDSSILKWQGFIIPKEYREPYESIPHVVSVKAQCGLDILGSYKYDGSIGRISESSIILNTLSKIEHTQFTEYVNIYDTSMNHSVNDSPFDQIKIDADIFEEMYYDEVLKETLKKYNACIIQKNGIFNIYRPTELIDTSIYGRTFTNSTTKTSTSFNPKQSINRSTNPSYFQQVSGGEVMIQSPAKKITINQDYGNKESWIDNYEFKANSWNGTDFEHWTKAGDVSICPISDLISGEKEGVAIQWEYPSTSKFIQQTFGSLAAVSASDAVILEFDYLYYNKSGSAQNPVYFYIYIFSAGGDYLHCGLDDLEVGKWTVDPNPYVIIGNSAPQGIPEWNHYKRSLPGIPAVGNYTIRILGTVNVPGLNVYVGVKNMQFYAVSTKILQKKVKKKLTQRIQEHDPQHFIFGGYGSKYQTVEYKEIVDTIVKNVYAKDNSINGIDIEYDYILGDVLKTSSPANDADTNINNILEQFAGALTISKLGTPADAAAKFVTDHSGAYSPGGVVVTNNWYDVIFTGNNGLNFTGNTTITNTAGDLNGNVVNTQAHTVSQKQIDTITVLPSTAGSGTAYVQCSGFLGIITWDSTRALSIENFYNNNVLELLTSYGVDLTYSASTLVFTAHVAGVPFTNSTYIENITPNISGTVANTQANITGQNRIDTITLSGATGTANILCDAVTRQAAIPTFALVPSTKWHTEPNGTENKPLLELIGDEIAFQYSRPKQLIQMPIQFLGSTDCSINIIGNFQDDMNQYNAVNRVLGFNRGTYDVANRKWEIDLMEIIK